MGGGESAMRFACGSEEGRACKMFFLSVGWRDSIPTWFVERLAQFQALETM